MNHIEPTKNRRIINDIIILYLAVLMTRIGYGLLIITFPIYIFTASGKAVGLSLALYPIFEASTATFIGSYLDKKGRKNIFLLGLLSSAIFISSIGLTINIYIVSFLHALMGISAAAITVSTLTMLTDLTVIENRGTGMGAFDFFNIIGYAIGILLSSWLITIFSYKLNYIFFVGGILFLIVALLSYFLKEPPNILTEQFYVNPFTALDRNVKSMLPLWFALTFLLGVMFFSPKVLMTTGIRPGESGLLLFSGAIILGIGSMFFGILSDKIGREKTILIGIMGILGLLSSLTYLIETNLIVEGDLLVKIMRIVNRNPIIAIILGISAFMTTAIVPSILAYTGDRVHMSRRGSAMGIYSTMLSIGIALGNLISGFTFDIGGPVAVFRIAVLTFILMLILTAILKFKK